MPIDAPEGSTFAYQYFIASGPKKEQSVYLCYRFLTDRGFDYDYLDSWICITRGQNTQPARGVRAWLTGIWRSDAGAIYASDADSGSIHRIAHHDLAQGQKDDPWVVERLGGALMGVWGLDETHVYTWGGVGKTCYVHMFDGNAWSRLPNIDGDVLYIRGCAPDCLYAVGNEGHVHHFDGQGWRRIDLNTRQTLTGVWVESPNEIYVCGHGGQLYELSADGFILRAEWTSGLQDVAKWQGDVWVASHGSGLLKLQPQSHELEVIKSNIVDVDRFDARQELLMAMGDRTVHTADGKRFIGMGMGLVRGELDSDPPMFDYDELDV